MAYSMNRVPITLIETPEFIKQAEKLLSPEERSGLLYYIGSNPESGKIMQQTGGVRKLRWAVEGRGKSSGVRIIYYYRDETLPIFLLTLYPKNVQDNLTQRQRNELRKGIPLLVKSYREGKWNGKKKK